MQKIKKGSKPEGRDTVSSSFELWEFRLEKGGGPDWSKRINDAPKSTKEDY